MMTGTTAKTKYDLRELLANIRDDPDAGPWAEWARRLMASRASRKRKAIAKAKASTASPPRTKS